MLDLLKALSPFVVWLNANAGALQALAGCIGVPGVLLSLFFLWRQVRDQTTATRATVYQNLTAMMIEIDRFFIDHSELRKYFYDGANISEKHDDYPRAVGVAEMFLDFADFVLMHKSEMGNYPWGEWEKYFSDMYATSPMLRAFWANKRDWYGDELKELFDPLTKNSA